jgi:hypothetical protein
MAKLNFTLKEEGWYESQPVQLSTGKFAISINFGDAANNRVVVYKSSNGKDYVPYKTALSVGEFCDINVDGLKQHWMNWLALLMRLRPLIPSMKLKPSLQE